MIRYMAAAVGLRVFSVNAPMRSAYRAIGNVIGQKRRGQQDIGEYVARGDLLVRLVEKYLGDRPQLLALELGTGWIHWFGLYLALNIDKEVSLELFDVWDNRQLDALKISFAALRQRYSATDRLDERLDEKLGLIETSGSFDELYSRCNARYRIESDGALDGYIENRHDLVFSFHVLEHIHRDSIKASIANMFRVLKPGGYCIHQVGIDDHLAHYDSTQSKKTYVRFSLAARRRLFENVVQYHNVLQPVDYLGYFQDAGFEMIDVEREVVDISDLRVHPDWVGYSSEDLATTILTVVLRKPV